MQTIITKSIPATNHKPARVKAYQQNEGKGKTVTVGWDEELHVAQFERDAIKDCHHSIRPHALAARRLMLALDWDGEMIAGHSDAGTVWVFSDSSDRIKCTRSAKPIKGHCPGCGGALDDPGEAELCLDCMNDATWPTGNAAPAPSEPEHDPREEGGQ